MSDSSQHNTAWYKRRLVILGIVLVLSVIGVRMYMPIAAQQFLNQKLQSTPGIDGSVGNVSIHLYRGAYEIENIEIFQAGTDQAPFLSIKHLDISILWSALLRGHVVSEVAIYQPVVTLIDRKDQQDIKNQEIKREQFWLGLARDVVPFSIDKVDVYNGTLQFSTDLSSSTKQTRLSSINGQISNITNSKELNESLVTDFTITGLLMDESQVSASGNADPFTNKPTFDLDVKIERFPVKYVSGLIQRYTPIDLEAGSIDGAVELVVDKGQIDGYVKAGIYDMTVFSWRQDIEKDGDNPFLALFEGLTGLVGELLENDESDLLAARVPLSGTLSDTETDTFAAILSVLENAFIEAVEMDIEDLFTLGKKSQQKKSNGQDAASDN